MDVGRSCYQLAASGMGELSAHLNSAEDARVEHVDTGVDAVADKLDGLLDETVDHGGCGLGNNDTIV